MTRVFLSYSSSGERVAEHIARWLRDMGVEIYWFQNPEQRGRRFFGEIERGIAEADLFVVLMSPAFLTSTVCGCERDIALQRPVPPPSSARSGTTLGGRAPSARACCGTT